VSHSQTPNRKNVEFTNLWYCDVKVRSNEDGTNFDMASVIPDFDREFPISNLTRPTAIGAFSGSSLAATCAPSL
jgi:hypothetical protein